MLDLFIKASKEAYYSWHQPKSGCNIIITLSMAAGSCTCFTDVLHFIDVH
jgi:hypothetical protein